MKRGRIAFGVVAMSLALVGTSNLEASKKKPIDQYCCFNYPNFIITKITPSKKTPKANQFFNVTVTIANKGSVAHDFGVQSAFLDLYLNAKNCVGPNFVGNYYVSLTSGFLPAGGSITYTFTDVSYNAKGTYYLRAQIDTDLQVPECCEADNESVVKQKVKK
jgi:hypothetical protein